MIARSHLLLGAVAALAGCAIYFSLPQEYLSGLSAARAVWAIVVLTLAAGLCLRRPRLGPVVLVFAAFIMAMLHAEFRARASLVPDPDWPERAVDLSGWIESIGPINRGRPRLTMRVDGQPICPSGPCRVRVLAKPDGAGPGDAVRLRAVLQPPRRAAVPGAYDFAFNAFHARIIGTGYAVTVARLDDSDPPVSFERRIAALRGRLSHRVRDTLPGRNGALAAALLSGDRSGLDARTQHVLRASGLGHILAISGLHMALFAGSVFLALRSVLALMPRLVDPAVPAALGAILAAIGYFLISGGSIPTQRALIMALIALGAVILRRRALSMHTLAIALIAVIAVQPHSVVTAGFQMSFAAAAALVAVFGALRRRKETHAHTAPHPLLAGVGGLSVTSLVAGGATGVVSAFHFHRIASLGLLANLLAMPVFTFVVMPAGLMAFLLMPVGLDGLALAVMGWGLDLVMAIAGFVADLPGAIRPVGAAPGWVFFLYAAGFSLLVCARPNRVRAAAGAVCAIALLVWAILPAPDLLVTERGIVLARFDLPDDAKEDGAMRAPWSSSYSRRDRFAQTVFLERQGGEPDLQRARSLRCDDLGCSGRVGRLDLVILTDAEAWQSDCARADLVIVLDELPVWVARDCAAEMITARDLREQGAVQIWLRAGRLARRQWVQPREQSRRWHSR